MKRVLISCFAVSLALAYSCSKPEIIETEEVPTPDDKEFVEIRIGASLDNEITKTAYDDNGKMTWCNNDQIALIVYEGSYSNQDRYSYTLLENYGDITNGGRHATFYGTYSPYNALLDDHKKTDGWLSTGFAVYPFSVTQINDQNYYNKPYIKLPCNVSGLASSIILVGTPDNDANVTDFLFKTAMAVLKVNIKNIPAEADEIRLTTSEKDTYPVDGDFTLVKGTDGVVTIGFDNYQDDWGLGYQSVDISSKGVIASEDFFFNVPVGTYPANTLSIEARAGGQVLMKKTIAKALTLPRNECLVLPSLIANYVTVDRNAVTPYLTYVNSDNTMIRVHISNDILTTTNYNKNDWKEENKFSSYSGNFNLYTLTDNYGGYYLNSTGNYYLNYLVLQYGNQTIPDALDDANVISYGSVPFYYLDRTSSKISLANCTVTASSTETTEGALENLWDGTTAYWHSVWDQGTHSYSEDYGVFIDIELPTGKALSKFQFLYQIRSGNNNGRPREVVYGYSNDGTTWTKIGSVATSEMDAAAGTWVHLPYVELSSSVQYLRFGITKAGDGTSLTGGSGSTALSELELYGE